MKFTNTLVGFCVLALVALTTAQTKISGTAQCGKPDAQQKVDVPDHPGHAISISQAKCTWSKPMEVAGLKSKEGVTTDMNDIHGDTAHGHGYYVDTMENGDKAFVSFQGVDEGQYIRREMELHWRHRKAERHQRTRHLQRQRRSGRQCHVRCRGRIYAS